MQVILLTDIDDSLMQTARKCAPPTAPSEDSLAVGALDSAGQASSFMTAKQQRLWSLLDAAADVRVPVTARSVSALSRVQLSFSQGAVCDFGATIVGTDGRPDAAWHAAMWESSARLEQAAVFEALARVVASSHRLLKLERRVVDGVNVFVNFRSDAGGAHDALKARVVASLEQWGVAGAYYLHCSDRDVMVLPRFIGKAHATRYLVQARGWSEELVLAMGDSLSDAGFMTQADYFLAPGASRVSRCLREAAADQGALP